MQNGHDEIEMPRGGEGEFANEGDVITTQRFLRAHWLGAPQNIQQFAKQPP